MSEVKTNKISPATGTSFTMGDSGDTFTIPSGASLTVDGTASGFGTNITWQTTKKTADFTAVSTEGYFIDTSSSTITATLPSSPSAGDIVAFKDYTATFATNNLTIARNGSNIQGNAVDSILSTNRASVVLVYIDSTKGWLYVQESNVGDLQNKQYVTATGGTITTSGDFKIHTFTSSGTFTVSDAGNAAGSNSVAYLVLAGGGGGGNAGSRGAGGGGAGGFREGKPSDDPYTASPLNAPAGLPVSAQGYPITVGAGGSGAPSNAQGGSSVFSTITSAGGGTGGVEASNIGDGGSGGGAGAAVGPGARSGGSGNTPPVSPPQGNDGGDSVPSPNPGKNAGGGGGGAGAVGNNAPTPGGDSGTGGAGATSSITGSPVQRGGGGGGSGQTPPAAGGDGGGGGGSGPTASSSPGNNGTANFGGGGGAGGSGGGGDGGSGVVIIRYKYQN
jgi:hypothetical protein